MKLKLLSLITLASVLSLAQAQDNKSDAFKDAKEKTSYSVGVNIGNAWKRQEIDLHLDSVLKGIRDALAGQAQLTEQEVGEVLRAFQAELRVKQEEKRKVEGEKNKADGAKFLSDNKTKPGVVTLPSGLQYKVIRDGDGPVPPTNATVTVHYRGTLLDGTEFDSSYGRKQPAEFNVNEVIKGWTEALQRMKTGSKWQLFIPADLAYGERGFGAKISPHATLTFEVELLGFKPPLPATPPEPVTSDIIKVPSAEELKKGAKIEIIKPDQIKKELEKPKQ